MSISLSRTSYFILRSADLLSFKDSICFNLIEQHFIQFAKTQYDVRQRVQLSGIRQKSLRFFLADFEIATWSSLFYMIFVPIFWWQKQQRRFLKAHRPKFTLAPRQNSLTPGLGDSFQHHSAVLPQDLHDRAERTASYGGLGTGQNGTDQCRPSSGISSEARQLQETWKQNTYKTGNKSTYASRIN